MLLAGPVRVRPGIATGRGISKSQARDCSGTARRAVLECDDSSQARIAVGRGISKSQARDCSGTALRAVPECDDSSQARDASGGLEESTRSATTRANELGPGLLRHEPGPGLLRGGGSRSHPPRSNPGLWLVATYLRTSHRCPLCKHAGGGGMCGGAWLVISTRSSFWG